MDTVNALAGRGRRTEHWHRLGDGRVRCDVCPRRCRLREGQRGLCFVRMRRDDAVVLTTYGRSSGFCVDPIEKKPLNHFLPGTAVLSFGTAGCNLTCRFCQNWDISKSREVDTLADAASPDRIARAARDLGCRSVAFTYNEPVIFMEYAVDVARACHELGVKAVAVTAGYVNPDARADLFRHMDAANVDLKAFSDDFYHSICAGRLAPVLETLEYLKHETDVWLEITNLLIPGLNDSNEEIDAMTRWVVKRLGPDVPMHFTAFHPAWKMRDRPPTLPETLTRARSIAVANGVRHAYTGNVHDPKGQSTRCAECGALLIERDGYELKAWNLVEEGRCAGCGTRCAGVFEASPGTWGGRRRPVRLGDHASASRVRPPAAAGTFYPADPGQLARTVDRLLASAVAEPVVGERSPIAAPDAIVVPHAGYVYSGPVAASAYALLRSLPAPPTRVAILGPAHFVPLRGLAVPAAGAWRTPLGEATIDAELREAAVGRGAVIDDLPHEPEHALEVQLPFLQRILGPGLGVLPVAVGLSSPGEVAELIEALCGVSGVLVVVSTDLSHYQDRETARRLDRRTADAVLARDAPGIGSEDACGVYSLRGIVEHARRHDLEVRLLDLRTSADTAGDPWRVVGYGAFAVGPRP